MVFAPAFVLDECYVGRRSAVDGASGLAAAGDPEVAIEAHC